MKFLNVSFYSLLIALLMFGCGTEETYENYKGTVIKGQIKGAENLKVYIDQMLLNNTANMMDKAEIDKNGKFVLKIEDRKDRIYRLRIGAKASILQVSKDDKVVDIQGDIEKFHLDTYTITGSETALDFNKMIKEQKGWKENQIKEYVNSSNNTLASMYAVVSGLQSDIPGNLEIYKKVAQKLNSEFPGTRYATDFTALIQQVQQRLALQKIRVGELAPEINLPDPSGKNYSLAALKGKVVLLDFWASWCRPCRSANPAVVKLYKKYKSKGFTVYSVSLDRNTQKDRWIKAIKDDNLLWPTHVSDLAGWQCKPAKEYGVSSIPKTFLLDKEGKIAGLNLHGKRLEDEVSRLLAL